jgi:hypothetical protein
MSHKSHHSLRKILTASDLIEYHEWRDKAFGDVPEMPTDEQIAQAEIAAYTAMGPVEEEEPEDDEPVDPNDEPEDLDGHVLELERESDRDLYPLENEEDR